MRSFCFFDDWLWEWFWFLRFLLIVLSLGEKRKMNKSIAESLVITELDEREWYIELSDIERSEVEGKGILEILILDIWVDKWLFLAHC